MDNLEAIKRRIQTATDLHSLVRTMKALAAVNIRQLERAVESLAQYQRTVEMGLSIVLRNNNRVALRARSAPTNKVGAIVFGSDQGMCGPLNDLVAQFTTQQLNARFGPQNDVLAIAIGARVSARLKDAGLNVQQTLPVAHSLAGITPRVQDLLVRIDAWHHQERIDQVIVFFAEHTSRSNSEMRYQNLLPIDLQWLQSLRQRPWPTNQIPTFTMEPQTLFSLLVQQYLFVSLYRASAESMASENASRLAAMQGAERNTGNRIDALTRQFHQTRQMALTEELLDIAAGFEAIESEESRSEATD